MADVGLSGKDGGLMLSRRDADGDAGQAAPPSRSISDGQREFEINPGVLNARTALTTSVRCAGQT
jgi:hypothetical protein